QVEDNGCGMDRETQAKVFAPFFTTKTRGPGLGLAIVKKIIQSMGGSITLESEKGRGTTCTIILPRD
ncbi:MAG: hypothetical protein HGA78_10505, partial [Nitrospirales bacterium]|nr:hypothetical protein [Nitrospirales bacterium]